MSSMGCNSTSEFASPLVLRNETLTQAKVRRRRCVNDPPLQRAHQLLVAALLGPVVLNTGQAKVSASASARSSGACVSLEGL